jgi:hypothetical protein
MEHAVDGEQVAASLAEWLAAVTFVDLSEDEVTALLVDSVVAWAEDRGWRAYRRAPSVMALPAPFSHRHSWLDVGCARPDGAPIAIEVDRTDRQRTVDKLLAEAEAGRVAIWVRWGTGKFAAPPPPVAMVTCPVTSHRRAPASDANSRAAAGREQRYSRLPTRERPAPEHTAADLTAGQQPDLFAGPGL